MMYLVHFSPSSLMKKHALFAVLFFIRLLVSQDRTMVVKYTDFDYHVSRFITQVTKLINSGFSCDLASCMSQ